VEETVRQAAGRFGDALDAAEVQSSVDEAVRFQHAIQTGETRGLSRSEQAVVKLLREIEAFTTRLGVRPPTVGGGKPGSIDELLDRAAECGTHSILDIERTARRSGFGVATPLSQTALRRAFGTSEPTHAQIEEHWASVSDQLGPWQARYAAVYDDGQPHEYVFIGCSGD
jgi:hypothetical protein